MQEVLQQKYWENTLQDYLVSIGILILGFLVVRLCKRILLQRLKSWASSTDSKTDDFVVREVERSLMPMLYIGVVYLSVANLTLPERADKVINILISAIVTFFVVRIITTTLRYILTSRILKREHGEEKARQIGGIMIIISAVIWITGALFLLDNWGVNVTTFVAGLGIGGIAIALAAQTILGDLFSYFVIFFDRPFEIGDFIIVQDKLGTVEYIGIKTTRLRSLGGEQLVFSNTDLTNSRVHNYKRMQRRRIVFSFAVPYNTPREKLAMIPDIVKRIITQQQEKGNAVFDRAHLLNLGPSNFTYECVYIVLTGDYNKYMDIQQAINLGICEAFENNGISFAHPTQTLYIHEQQNGREVAA
jgi:small-conductance mechanosensitive channel